MTIYMASSPNALGTLQVYGYQSMKEGASSEQIVGRVAKESGQHCVLGTKFFTVCPCATPYKPALCLRAQLSMETCSMQHIGQRGVAVQRRRSVLQSKSAANQHPALSGSLAQVCS